MLIAVWYKAHGRHVDWATELSSLILLLAFLDDAFSKAFLRISGKIGIVELIIFFQLQNMLSCQNKVCMGRSSIFRQGWS